MKKILAGLLALFCGLSQAQQVYVGPNVAGKSFFSMATSKVDDFGNVVGQVPTYRAVMAAVTPAATATDVLVIQGSATKTIKITRVQITYSATAAGSTAFYLYIRTSANTGGTTSSIVPVAHDQNDAASTATAFKYTANPTSLGTGLLIASDYYSFPAAASPTFEVLPWIIAFGDGLGKPIYLRGTSQYFAVNMGGAAVAAGAILHVLIEYTEE